MCIYASVAWRHMLAANTARKQRIQQQQNVKMNMSRRDLLSSHVILYDVDIKTELKSNE